MTTALSPVRADSLPVAPGRLGYGPDRVVGLDVARALAVFGMFGAHLGDIPDDVDASPSTWLAVAWGRPSILFAVLAGVSLALLSGRTSPVTGHDLVRARIRILVRAAWIFAIGGVLDALGTDLDIILGVYAVLFVLALPFLGWSPRRLLLAAGVLAVLSPPAVMVLGQFITAHGQADEAPFPLLAVTGFYPALIWWTFILVGLAVGRSDLQSGRVRATMVAAGAGLAVLGYGGGWVTTQWWADGRLSEGPYDGKLHPGGYELAWLSGASPHSGTTFEIVGSVGVALVVIAVCLVVAERLPTVTFPLAAVGSMALTVYTAQVVAIWAIGTTDYDSNWPWLTYVLATLGTATVWRLVLGRGPLERLLTWTSRRAAGGGAVIDRATPAANRAESSTGAATGGQAPTSPERSTCRSGE
jgi:uncharacterized membrane protein YeiB